jgi:hypothetical protein
MMGVNQGVFCGINIKAALASVKALLIADCQLPIGNQNRQSAIGNRQYVCG